MTTIAYHTPYCVADMDANADRQPPFDANQSLQYSAGVFVTQSPNNQSTCTKTLIEKHPLFPLLTLISQKCELTTSCEPPQTCDAARNDDQTCSNANADRRVTSSRLFDDDILCFARSFATKAMHTNARHLSACHLLFTSNEELDSLMVGAIRVLRLQLLEIEKVYELADRFVAKYVNSVRDRVLPGIAERDDASDCCESPVASAGESDAGCEKKRSRKRKAVSAPTTSHAHAHAHALAAPTRLIDNFSNVSNEKCTTWLKRIIANDNFGVGVEEPPPDALSENKRHQSSFSAGAIECISWPKNSCTSADEADEEKDLDAVSCGKRSAKRGVFPKTATNALRAWLFQHLHHPYPTEEQKRQLSQDTNLSVLQVNNWFINARRRIVQPMIDQSNLLSTTLQ